MDKNDIIISLNCLGEIQISTRRQIGLLEKQIKALQKQLKVVDKEIFTIRSSKEYEELYIKRE